MWRARLAGVSPLCFPGSSVRSRTLSCSRLRGTRQRRCSRTGSSISCSQGPRRSRERIRWPSALACWICSIGCGPTVRSSCSSLTICSGLTGRHRVQCCLLCGACVPTRCWQWCRRGPVGWPIPAGRGSWAVTRVSLACVCAGLARVISPSWRARWGWECYRSAGRPGWLPTPKATRSTAGRCSTRSALPG